MKTKRINISRFASSLQNIQREGKLKTYLKRFSAPDLSMSSLLICMLSLDLWVWSLPRHVAALGSEPCNQRNGEQIVNYQKITGRGLYLPLSSRVSII